MIDRPRMIGYNRTVKLRWLDETLDLFLAGMSDADIYEALRERLKDELSVGSTAQRGSREKTITLLMKTWVRVPPPLRELREDCLHLLQGVRRSERLPLHWGMTMAVYPFWRVVADVTGPTVSAPGNGGGDAGSAAREGVTGREGNGRKIGAVCPTSLCRLGRDRRFRSKPVSIRPLPPFSVADSKLAVWLLEAAVVSASGGVLEFRSLVNGPCLFPFQICRLAPEQLAESGRLEVVRHNLEETVVRVRKPMT